MTILEFSDDDNDDEYSKKQGYIGQDDAHFILTMAWPGWEECVTMVLLTLFKHGLPPPPLHPSPVGNE